MQQAQPVLKDPAEQMVPAQKEEEQKKWQQMFYSHQYNYELQENQLAYERSQKMTNVRKAIEQVLPNAYDKIDQLKDPCVNDSQKLTRLHYARGTKLLSDHQSGDVLEFDLGGSGYYMPRKMHKGYEERKEENKFDEKSGKNIHAGLRWYEKVLSWIPGLRSLKWNKEELRTIQNPELLKKRDAEIEEGFRKEYGEKVTIGGKQFDQIRMKKQKNKTRISLAGPLLLRGAMNKGTYSIKNLREYMKTMGVDYLQNIFRNWDSTDGEDPHQISILIRGHSRGGVAASEGAMMIKAWLWDNYPEYEGFVKFELLQMDPVPGFGSRHGINEEVNHKGNEAITEDGDKMLPLGDSQETTVVYSLRTNHGIGFAPQAVKGAKRIILMAAKHDVGLDQIDKSHLAGTNGEEAGQHRNGYTDASTGEVYRGQALAELGEGIYIADEQNNLIRLNSYADAKKIVAAVMTDQKTTQEHRKEIIDRVLQSWFGEHAETLQSNDAPKGNPAADPTDSSVTPEKGIWSLRKSRNQIAQQIEQARQSGQVQEAEVKKLQAAYQSADRRLFAEEQKLGLVRPYHRLSDDRTAQNFSFALQWLNEDKTRHNASPSYRKVVAALNQYAVQRQVGMKDMGIHEANLAAASQAVAQYLASHQSARKTTDGAVRVAFMEKLSQLLDKEKSFYFNGK